MNKKYFVSLFVVLGFLVAASALAQNVDLGVADPGILPTSRLYFLKEWGRGIKMFFTFDQVKKADLQADITNEKAAEAQKVEENSPQNTDAIKSAIENYKNSLENLKARLESLKENSQNPNTDKLLSKLADRAVKHEKLFAELEKKFEGNSDLEKLADDAKNASKVVSEVLNNKVQKTLENSNAAKNNFVCTQEFKPVCGADGKTYSNACFAKVAGVEVNYRGECKPEITPKPQPTVNIAPVKPILNTSVNEISNATVVIGESGNFNPQEVKIKKGGKVTWVNKSQQQVWPASNPHPIHTDYPGFDALRALATGESYSFIFEKVGSWGYHNHFNPGMRGEVKVVE